MVGVLKATLKRATLTQNVARLLRLSLPLFPSGCSKDSATACRQRRGASAAAREPPCSSSPSNGWPEQTNVVTWATLDAARSSSGGRGWDTSGRGLTLGVPSCPRATKSALRRRGHRAGALPRRVTLTMLDGRCAPCGGAAGRVGVGVGLRLGFQAQGFRRRASMLTLS